MRYIRRLPLGLNPALPPGVPVEIDWNHPLAQGLVACYVPQAGMGAIVDLVGGPPLVVGSGAVRGQTYRGPGLVSTTSTSGATLVGVPQSLRLAVSGTLFWSGTFAGSPDANSSIFGLAYDNAGTTPFSCFSLDSSSGSGSINFTGNGAGTFFNLVGSGTTISTSTRSLGASFVVGGNVAFFANGANFDNQAWGQPGAPSYAGTPTLDFDTYAGVPTRNSNCSGIVGLVYNWALPVGLQQWLDAEPFAMLVPRARRTVGPQIAAGRPFFVATDQPIPTRDLRGVAIRSNTNDQQSGGLLPESVGAPLLPGPFDNPRLAPDPRGVASRADQNINGPVPETVGAPLHPGPFDNPRLPADPRGVASRADQNTNGLVPESVGSPLLPGPFDNPRLAVDPRGVASRSDQNTNWPIPKSVGSPLLPGPFDNPRLALDPRGQAIRAVDALESNGPMPESVGPPAAPPWLDNPRLVSDPRGQAIRAADAVESNGPVPSAVGAPFPQFVFDNPRLSTDPRGQAIRATDAVEDNGPVPAAVGAPSTQFVFDNPRLVPDPRGRAVRSADSVGGNGPLPESVLAPTAPPWLDNPRLSLDPRGQAIRAADAVEANGPVPGSVGAPFVASADDSPIVWRDPRRAALAQQTPSLQAIQPVVAAAPAALASADLPVLLRDPRGVAARAQLGSATQGPPPQISFLPPTDNPILLRGAKQTGDVWPSPVPLLVGSPRAQISTDLPVLRRDPRGVPASVQVPLRADSLLPPFAQTATDLPLLRRDPRGVAASVQVPLSAADLVVPGVGTHTNLPILARDRWGVAVRSVPGGEQSLGIPTARTQAFVDTPHELPVLARDRWGVAVRTMDDIGWHQPGLIGAAASMPARVVRLPSDVRLLVLQADVRTLTLRSDT